VSHGYKSLLVQMLIIEFAGSDPHELTDLANQLLSLSQIFPARHSVGNQSK
jgi:hypothetical protein